uniref:AT-rich interactive domain-containing protein 2 n=3 Tax=Anthurium amnicola TaxID=1678845 RepID=A0A1D1XL60_9ARAE
MVSDYMSFTDDGSYQFAFNHSLQVNHSSQPASFVEIPPYLRIPEKRHVADEGVEVFSQSYGEYQPLGDCISVLSAAAEHDLASRGSDCHLDNGRGSISQLAWGTSRTQEDTVRSEHMKRSPTADEYHYHPFKRAKQVDYSVAFELPHLTDAHGEAPISDAASKDLRINRDALPVDLSEIASGSTSRLSRSTCHSSEGECKTELPIGISFSPSFVETNHQSSGFIHPEDIYFSLLDCYPRKHVAVGPDHQADIPALSEEFDPSVHLHHVNDEDDNEKFLGACIVPMPDRPSVAPENAEVTVRRCHCICPDHGSIECVRQHVMEAREKLMETCGQINFIELGLCDMGEFVAQKWTEEEERRFIEVISVNPTSLCKNFWDYLPQYFPSKSIKDLVSYYFNVYMLRKRAEQNRLDPLNIDSDNDEWQESDDGEFVMGDCEGDSVAQTPCDQDDIYNSNGDEEDDFHEEVRDGDACYDCAATIEDHDQEHYGVLKGQTVPKLNFVPRPTVNSQDVVGEDDIQDDSSTSHEGHHNASDTTGGSAFSVQRSASTRV